MSGIPPVYESLQHHIVAASVVTLEGCWLWMHSVCNKGYGHLWVNKRAARAHRVSYEVFTGRRIPSGWQVDHLCGNTNCVNPEHLECVAAADNRYRQWQRNNLETCPDDYQLE